MLDLSKTMVKMGLVGREDRALLRSNPSARADAGRWTGDRASAKPLSSHSSSGLDAINLFPTRPWTVGMAGNVQKYRPVGHMSLS